MEKISKALKEDFNIEFLLIHIKSSNCTILDYLIASDNYEDYMYSLVEAYNPAQFKM
jgi:hypothetical protein